MRQKVNDKINGNRRVEEDNDNEKKDDRNEEQKINDVKLLAQKRT